MRVGQFTTWLSRRGGGIPAAMLPLARSLEREETLVTVFGLSEKQGEPPPGAEGLRVRTLRPADGGIFGYAPKQLAGLLDERLDLLHQHGLWQYPSIVSLRWHSRTAKPYLVSPHGMLDPWALGNSAWKKRLAGSLFQNRHLVRAACLHALNMAELRAIREYGLRNPTAVVPNGIDLPREGVSVQPQWTSRIPPEAKVLLYLGRIHPKKGLPALIRAWHSSAPQSWHLVIAGWDQGGHETLLKRLARDLGISATITFAGPQFGGEKAASLHRADAFVLPSLSEGLPMSVLEAWSYRLPVLMSSACNLPEGFSADAALALPPEDNAMGARLAEFLTLSDGTLRRMGSAGRRLVEERFTRERVARDMAAVYRWTLGGGAAPGVVDR